MGVLVSLSLCGQAGEAHIFLLSAVISRLALMMRSRRSWCSSSSSRKFSKIEIVGLFDSVESILTTVCPSQERFVPIEEVDGGRLEKVEMRAGRRNTALGER